MGRDVEAIAEQVFTALADPTRRSILATLAAQGPATATDLSNRLPITRQAIAKHLVLLADAGLVTPEPGERRRVRYRLNSAPMQVAQQFLAALAHDWDGRLEALRDHLDTPPLLLRPRTANQNERNHCHDKHRATLRSLWGLPDDHSREGIARRPLRRAHHRHRARRMVEPCHRVWRERRRAQVHHERPRTARDSTSTRVMYIRPTSVRWTVTDCPSAPRLDRSTNDSTFNQSPYRTGGHIRAPLPPPRAERGTGVHRHVGTAELEPLHDEPHARLPRGRRTKPDSGARQTKARREAQSTASASAEAGGLALPGNVEIIARFEHECFLHGRPGDDRRAPCHPGAGRP